MAVELGSAGGRFTASFTRVSPPFSAGIWFRMPDVTAEHLFFQLNDTIDGTTVVFSASGNVSGDPLRVFKVGYTNDTSSGFSANTWHHALMVYAGGNAVNVYLDGGSKSSNPSYGSANFDSLKLVYVGTGGVAQFAEASIWDAALTDDEAAMLGRGLSSRMVRPANLIFMAPLIREQTELGGRSMPLTLGTGTVFDHPRITYRKSRHTFFAPPPNVVSVGAINTLALTGHATLARQAASASNSIAFSQRSFPPRVVVSAANTLDLDQNQKNNNIAENDLTLEQTAFLSRVNRSVEQTLRLKQLVRAKTGNIASGRYRR